VLDPIPFGALFGLFRMRGVHKCDATWHTRFLWFWYEFDTCGAGNFRLAVGFPSWPDMGFNSVLPVAGHGFQDFRPKPKTGRTKNLETFCLAVATA
jgi:hypothetical protein